jgi:selenocysteine lyase/cysteine desulfurase
VPAIKLYGLSLNEDGEVIGANTEELSGCVPIVRLIKQRGIKFKLIKADSCGWVDLEKYRKPQTKKTKLIIICHVGNIYSTILDI